MTRFAASSFTVAPGTSSAYRNNYDAIFGKKKGKKKSGELPQREIEKAHQPLEDRAGRTRGRRKG